MWTIHNNRQRVELTDARPPRTAPASRRQRVLPSPCHPRLRCNGIVCCCAHRTALWRTPYCALSIGTTQQFFLFVPGDLDLWPLTLTYEIGRDFCTIHLTAKFHRPMFNLWELRADKQTNKQTDRHRWKYPPRSAMVRRWVNILDVCIYRPRVETADNDIHWNH